MANFFRILIIKKRSGYCCSRNNIHIFMDMRCLICLLILLCGSQWSYPQDYIYWTNYGITTIGRANLDGSNPNQSFITACNTPRGIAANTTHLVWVNNSTIGRANLDGSDVNQSFITNCSLPRGVAINSSKIFWTNSSGNTIRCAELDGSNVTTLVANCNYPSGITISSNYMFWTQYQVTGYIGRADIDGQNPQIQWLSGCYYPRGVAVNEQYIFFSNDPTITLENRDDLLDDLMRDDLRRDNLPDNLVWDRRNDEQIALEQDVTSHDQKIPSTPNVISKADISGSNLASFITQCNTPVGIALTDTYIFWANQGSHTIGRAKLDGSEPNANFIVGCNKPYGLCIVQGLMLPEPSDLKAVLYPNYIALTWKDRSLDEIGFEIQRKDRDGQFQMIGQVAKNVTTYYDYFRTLAGSSFPEYRVRAVGNNGYMSKFSNTASIADIEDGGNDDHNCGLLGLEFVMIWFLVLIVRCQKWLFEKVAI